MNGMMSVDLPGLWKIRSGKVREVFDLGETLLIVATDRISAFDCILPEPIPGKGEVLTQLSAFWFRKFHQIPNHFITGDFQEFPKSLQPYGKSLRGRSMLVRKSIPLPEPLSVIVPAEVARLPMVRLLPFISSVAPAPMLTALPTPSERMLPAWRVAPGPMVVVPV